MVREGLAKYQNQQRHYFADVSEISSFGRKFADKIPAICLSRVRFDRANFVTDHAWISPFSMNQMEPFPTSLNVGDTIGFYAIVARYEKGQAPLKKFKKVDFGLFGIRAIEIIGEKVKEDVC